MLVTSVMNFPIHEYPYDYWRFTPDGFKSLLKEFSYSIVDILGEKSFPHTVVGIGIKNIDICDETKEIIRNKMDEWKRLQNPKGIRKYIREWVPPILVELYRKVRYR